MCPGQFLKVCSILLPFHICLAFQSLIIVFGISIEILSRANAKYEMMKAPEQKILAGAKVYVMIPNVEDKENIVDDITVEEVKVTHQRLGPCVLQKTTSTEDIVKFFEVSVFPLIITKYFDIMDAIGNFKCFDIKINFNI